MAGRRFDVNQKLKLRPTTDMAKEALFNMLSARFEFEGKRVLDLFAGTGGIGIEFASRGAAYVLFVEKVPRHAAGIRKLVMDTGLDTTIEVRVADVLRFLRSENAIPDEHFDFIFADPPYNLPEIPALPEQILCSGLLAPNGILILEHPKEYDFSANSQFILHRSYSAVNFSLFSQSALS